MDAAHSPTPDQVGASATPSPWRSEQPGPTPLAATEGLLLLYDVDVKMQCVAWHFQVMKNAICLLPTYHAEDIIHLVAVYVEVKDAARRPTPDQVSASASPPPRCSEQPGLCPLDTVASTPTSDQFRASVTPPPWRSERPGFLRSNTTVVSTPPSVCSLAQRICCPTPDQFGASVSPPPRRSEPIGQQEVYHLASGLCTHTARLRIQQSIEVSMAAFCPTPDQVSASASPPPSRSEQPGPCPQAVDVGLRCWIQSAATKSFQKVHTRAMGPTPSQVGASAFPLPLRSELPDSSAADLLLVCPHCPSSRLDDGTSATSTKIMAQMVQEACSGAALSITQNILPYCCSAEAISSVSTASAVDVFRLCFHGELWLVLSLVWLQRHGSCSKVSRVHREWHQLCLHHRSSPEDCSRLRGPKLCVLILWAHGELWLVLSHGDPTPCCCTGWPGAAHGSFNARWSCEGFPSCPCFNPLLSRCQYSGRARLSRRHDWMPKTLEGCLCQ